MLSEKIRDRFYKGVVIFYLFSAIPLSTSTFITFGQNKKFNTKTTTPWLSCAPQVCSKTDNREPCLRGGATTIETESLSQDIARREALPVT